MRGKKANYTIPPREGESVKPAYSAIHILSTLHLVASPTPMGVAVQDATATP